MYVCIYIYIYIYIDYIILSDSTDEVFKLVVLRLTDEVLHVV